ncbi:type II toxin-antitoxin system RelE/ParE family toxin [Pseudanabaena sp. ABRG5-3]|uniref:type II toxin-antitoxin system RelE/ParE family toxin n=1 Tax=Pseudanabaena sp. ABRG5-3 TaxID=685565 RepID=UPI000DC73197|nr:type II toxin-antitoxin system RelE/ParE family toxin [Pseudanabaena sp. ABRG5-3]BBC26945.1 addiction module toxin, RelE/StbE family [Pseudanabaena sp. ABRG5-3]
METDQPIVQVETSNNFERQFRILFKRYRKIRSDVQPVIEQLQSGEVLGDRLSGLNIMVFKVRVKNSDIQKGKSAGYRLIYQLEAPTRIILLAIYAKSDQSSISTMEIEEIVEAFKRQQEQPEI